MYTAYDFVSQMQAEISETETSPGCTGNELKATLYDITQTMGHVPR